MCGEPAVAGSSSAGALRNGDHADRTDVRFARPNIQIYDAYVVDLYQWVCARYFVGVEVQNNGKAQLSSALDRISEQITLASKTPSRPEAIRESTIEQQRFTLYFNRIWRREWDSNPRLSFPNTRFPSVLLKPLGHLSADGASEA